MGKAKLRDNKDTPKESLTEEACFVDTSTKDNNWPETSPYVTPAFILSIGPSRIQYTVLKEFLYQCPKLCKLDSWRQTIALPEVNEDIGHSLVHYLYTGTYQTLKPRDVSEDVKRTIEYKRNIQLYCAARMYGLDGLELLVKSNIESFEEEISIFCLLDIAEEAYQKLSDDEIWFTDYLTKELKAAFKTDETLFSRQCFLNRIGKVKNLDKALVKSIVKIYTNKTASTANKEEIVFEEAICGAPYEETPAPVCSVEPICCEETAPSIHYDEPNICEEAHCEEVPCGEAPCEEMPKAVCYEEPIYYEETAPSIHYDEPNIYEEAQCEEVPCGEAPCEEMPEAVCYEEPICCEETALPIHYDKRASCEEVSCRVALCGEASREEVAKVVMKDKTFLVKGEPFLLEKPTEDTYVRTKKGRKEKSKNSKAERFQDAAESVPEPAVQPEIEHKLALEPEPTLKPDIEENSVCIFRAKHLLEGDLWKNCKKCRAVIRQVSLQLARERSANEVEYEIVDRILVS